MDGPALSWFQWMFRNGLITSWQSFLQALESRFAPSFYDDPKGALFKLTQRSSVNEYLNEFERVANRIVGLQPSFLLSCFILGLTPELRREAISLAKLQEDKLEDRRRSYRPRLLNNPPQPSQPPPPQTNPPLPTLLQSPNPTPKTQIKRLTPEELATKRERGLCYNCDDKWSPSHRCKAPFFLLIAEDDVPDLDPPPQPLDDPTSPTAPDTSHVQISFNALADTSAPEALRLYGHIHHSRLTILIDGRSTHNFVQTRVEKYLQLPLTVTPPLQVTVGNGTTIPCNQLCQRTALQIQGQTFYVDLHVLPISGVDIVLGVTSQFS
ncbi:hypothetical protein GmHk_03G007703 [Glycine max]|nr:hypothetical protein GmHk_03G007703 [Glycine max]